MTQTYNPTIAKSCPACGHLVPTETATRVSIHGMYDCHAFCKYEGKTVDEVIASWLSHTPDTKYGPTSLCPAIVLDGDKELRRVGEMIHVNWKTGKPDMEAVERYRAALKADPDIQRVLASTSTIA